MIALLLALMIIAKEALMAATFFPVALAMCLGADGRLVWPVRSRRNVMLVGVSAAALFAVSLPVLWALTQGSGGLRPAIWSRAGRNGRRVR